MLICVICVIRVLLTDVARNVSTSCLRAFVPSCLYSGHLLIFNATKAVPERPVVAVAWVGATVGQGQEASVIIVRRAAPVVPGRANDEERAAGEAVANGREE